MSGMACRSPTQRNTLYFAPPSRVGPVADGARTDNVEEAQRLLSAVFGPSEIDSLQPTAALGLELRHMGFERAALFCLRNTAGIDIVVDHRRHLIFLCQDGAASVVQEDASIPLSGAQAVILAPSARGRLSCSPGTTLIGVTISEADFRREAATVLRSVSSARLGGTRGFDISANPGRIFRDAMQMLQADLDNAEASRSNRSVRLMFDRLIVYSLLQVVGSEAFTQTSGAKNSLAPRHIKRAEDYIKAHLTEPFDNVRLAQVAQVSPRSLYRGFIQFRGMTPARYVQELRLDDAHKKLTVEGRGRDICVIAAEAGFRSYASFWRSYVRKFGAPPSKSRPPRGGEDSSRS